MAKKDGKIREGKVVKTPDEEFENDSDVEFIGDDAMLLPNDGSAFDEEQQEEQDQEVAEDQALFSGNEALIDAVFEWLDAEIADCDSIEAAKALAKVEKVPIETAIEALNLCRKVFEGKRVAFQNIRDTVNT
jgi:hypothetical protein